MEAFARFDGTEAFLAIVGPDDGHLEEVQRLIQKHNLSNRIICPGLLTGEEVYSAYRDFDLFVLPCRADTFPSVIMEACAANLPMVITDRCEMAYLVKDRVADVVPFDVELFSRAMKDLLLDDKRYLFYKSNCNQVLKDTFSLDVTVDKLERLYQEVIIEKSNLNDII